MKILHISPTYFPATYWGGPIYSTFGLCNSLAKLANTELKVLTTDSAGPNLVDQLNVSSVPVTLQQGYAVYYCHRKWGADFAPEMFRRLIGLVRWTDVVHLTGVYSPPTIPTLLVASVLRKPVVWSPRGSLQRWKGSTRIGVKQAWERVCNRLITQGRTALHVTSQDEAQASIACLSRARPFLIPNGVEIPVFDSERIWRPQGSLRLLFIGRLHPKKGIENLLEALASYDLAHVRLNVCGEGEPEYRASLEQHVSNLGLASRVSFVGQVSGEMKHLAFSSADVCVVPSFTENFGMVVAEALAHGVPVVVSKGAPWSELETRGCGLWAENSVVALRGAILEIQYRNLAVMGALGRQWMLQDFGWDSVARRMHDLYRGLINAK